MQDYDLADITRRMDGAVSAFQTELVGLRTGRASTGLLDSVQADVYGAKMPLNQVASLSVPEPRLITVQVWDKENVRIVEKAIINSGLGLNPQSEGQLIRIPIPELSQERRVELAKIAGKYAEQARIAVRNVRRDGMEALKKSQKDGDMSEDEQKQHESDVQQATDTHIAEIDELLKQKEAEITQV